MTYFTQYLAAIRNNLAQGDATEHTHRPALKAFLEAVGQGVTATNEPKRVQCGAPDYIVSRKSQHGPVTLGYIEAKDVGKPLDEIERSEQMKRYRSALPNLILTDYLEFRWYVGGDHRQSARLARVSKGSKIKPDQDGAKAVSDLLAAFLSQQAEPINDPKALALRMARLTHFIRDMIVKAFENQAASATLRDLHQAFEKALIPDLPTPQFADMFAQTLAYGLFAARCNHHGRRGSFKRLGAASEIPKTNPFLRQLFETITGTALDEEPFVGFVDDLAQLLADTEIEAVLADFGKRTKRQDPVVHFYETFLAAYDPKLREARGVYYTPEPVVSYIVRSVDHLLKTRFGCPKGLADTATVEYEREEENGGKPKKVKTSAPRVLILDPACGTGTFLYTVIDHIREEFVRQGNAGMWSGYVRNHLLPRIFGFELLMAPYAVAHFKLGMQLAGHDLHPAQREKWAYDFSGDERLRVFLTNTLEEAERRAQMEFGFLRTLTEEANAAVRIKRELPILAVIGNPPYSGHSANRSWETKGGKRIRTFIGNLLQDYYQVDGQPLGERNPKWLQDDYVKFLRFGQWRIERTGAGILAFITNNGYLDNPTFRGMRQQLMNAFTDIYVLDLHGNAKKKEKCPDGSKDENVFDIQQGVAIGIFVKEPGKQGPAKVHHADLWGLRKSKYKGLFDRDVATSKWKALKPTVPFYLFAPQDTELREEYEQGWKVTEVLPVNSVGIVTARDYLTIRWSKQEVQETIRDFVGLPEEEARTKYSLGKDVQDWKVSLAQQDLRNNGIAAAKVKAILYRPFDHRFTYYTGQTRGFICRPRPELMRHMLAGWNVGLLTTRQTRDKWDVLAAKLIVGHKSLSAFDITSLFPLYLYPATEGETLSHWPAGPDGRRLNLNPAFVADMEKRLCLRFRSAGFQPALEASATALEASKDAGATSNTKTAELRIRNRGHLPHWEKEGGTYFVTFRLADSLPQAVLQSFEFERRKIIQTAERQGRDFSETERGRLSKLFSERIEAYLDSGTGACSLNRPEIADMVAEALRRWDGKRYRLFAWCVMPNHVHVVLQASPDQSLEKILHSWKSFTANRGNKILGRAGEFWQREYYDHLVRDEKDLSRIVQYVAGNPAKAHLKDWQWVWCSAGFQPALEASKDAGATGTFGPEDVFNYIYAVFNSPTYRKRYAEFLKIDFPHVPLTSNVKLFRSLCRLGAELVTLHLLESPKLAKPIARFPVKGANLVEKGYPKYVAPGEPEPGTGKKVAVGRVYISKGDAKGGEEGQYFEGVPPEVWEFHIGGYQVCEKWLKDRRGRTLAYDDLEHYSKVVTAIRETIRLMGEIDNLIPGWPLS